MGTCTTVQIVHGWFIWCIHTVTPINPYPMFVIDNWWTWNDNANYLRSSSTCFLSRDNHNELQTRRRAVWRHNQHANSCFVVWIFKAVSLLILTSAVVMVNVYRRHGCALCRDFKNNVYFISYTTLSINLLPSLCPLFCYLLCYIHKPFQKLSLTARLWY